MDILWEDIVESTWRDIHERASGGPVSATRLYRASEAKFQHEAVQTHFDTSGLENTRARSPDISFRWQSCLLQARVLLSLVVSYRQLYRDR